LTGELIIVITAGVGTFEVDSQLASDTKEKMMEEGIGCDIISVARPPMYNVPLFKYKNRRKEDLVQFVQDYFTKLFSTKHHMTFLIGFT
jgi:hypothetical protein